MNYFGLTGLINFVTCISLGFFVLLQDKKNLQKISYFILNCSVAVFSLGYFLWQTSTTASSIIYFKVLVVGIILINPAYLFFVFVFLEKIKSQRYPLLIVLVLNLFFITANLKGDLYVNFVEKFNIGLWPNPTLLFSFYLGFWLLQCLYGFYFLFSNFRKENEKRKVQIKYFTIAAIIGFIGGGTNWPIWYGINFPPYANILISVYIAIVAYAIVRHQLMDIEVIIKKTLVFAGLFAVSYGIFAGFAYVGSILFENIVRNRWVAMVPSVFVIVLILRPLELFLRNTTDKYLFQKKYDYRELLRAFTGEVLMVLDLKKLLELTVDKLAEIVKLDSASILLYDENSKHFEPAAITGGKAYFFTLSYEDEIVRHMRASGRHIFAEDMADKDIGTVRFSKKINELRVKLMIPLMHQDDMPGILCLGGKKSDENFTQDDVDILLSLSKTLSIAIINARLFEKLSEAQAQAAQREKMAVIGTLSAGINHEICNPLGIARGQCEMFLLNMADGIYKDKSPDELLEKAQDIMNKVIHETDRATVITRKLSSFAKPAKGETTDDVAVEDELEEVIALVEHEMKMDNIEIRRDIKPGLERIYGDRKQIQEILFNIIRNAGQAIKSGGEITVSARNAGRKVYVDIKDTGEGISKKDLKQIFDPFFTTKEPGKGTGLGLFIVKQIVERNEGRISVESEQGKGTTFSLEFRVAGQDGEVRP